MIDFDLAFAWHKTFLRYLDQEIDGQGQPIGRVDPCDESRCDLGHWLRGSGRALAELTHFDTVASAHWIFHEQSCAMMRRLAEGDRQTARSLRHTDVAQASDAVVAAIDALRSDYIALPAEAQIRLDAATATPTVETQWEHAIHLGLPGVDNEHRALIALANRLRENPRASLREEAVVDLLTALGHALVTHFNHEEAIMRQIGMPLALLDAHIVAHNRILDQYADLNIAAAAGTAYRAVDVYTLVMDWVGRHMVDHDLCIKDYFPAGN
jgi:hemerythrin-like metal-binding protein